MGMCAMTFCCPPMCIASTIATSIPTCCAPRIALHPAWLVVAVVALVIGLGVYIDMTIKCTELTGRSLGWAPLEGTGVWVNGSLYDWNMNSSEPFSEPPELWLPPPGQGHDGEVLVNFTKRDLGFLEPQAWSPFPTAYSGKSCYSTQNGNYFGQGLIAAIFLSIGASLLSVSAVALLLKKTTGECCGRPFEFELIPAAIPQETFVVGAVVEQRDPDKA
ncbi:unnamed protein product [Polarella glacialis]|uniref:Uncharacterized protein n=1 Tax=Polarella glacialis TaxID=89957 RepID=A0A813E3F6_POLGL|nr:unnamed protein product [Polarella glacialis]